MSTLKRKGVDSSVHENCPQVKRSVTINTVNKWIAENDKKLSITTWLCYDKANRDCVSVLKCSVCIRFQDKLRSDKNFNSAYTVPPRCNVPLASPSRERRARVEHSRVSVSCKVHSRGLLASVFYTRALLASVFYTRALLTSVLYTRAFLASVPALHVCLLAAFTCMRSKV